MNFISDFIWQSTLAALVTFLVFSLPGLSVLRLLGLINPKRFLVALLMAPAFGLCTYGPFSLAFTALVGYSVFTLIIAWLLFQAIILLWIRYQTISTNEHFLCHISQWHSLWLLIGAAVCAMIPTFHIFPVVYQDGLFINVPIFDHAKIAIVDAIAREGLLPINPYYAPAGERIPLTYYYLWHFFASQIKLLTHVTGWQAEVALNWFTAFASLSFLSALAIHFTQKARAGLFILLLALTGAPADLLPWLWGPYWTNWVGYPPVHGLELWWIQAAWVPQHLFSALVVIVFIFLVTQVLTKGKMLTSYAIVIGLTTATAFGASIWVGGIALLFGLPFLIGMALWLRLPLYNYLNTFKTLLFALLICLLFAIPVLISLTTGPSLAQSELPFGPHLYTATSLFNKASDWGYIAHIILYWLQFLPLNLGIVFVLGTASVLLYTSKIPEERNFWALSFGAIFGFLLIVQFLQSTIANNDFGWRAVLVPVMLLMVWSAIALTALFTSTDLSKWRISIKRWQPLILSLTMVGLTIGFLSFTRISQLPVNPHYPPDAHTLALHQGFLRQQQAWAKVRQYAKPTDLVQSNPDGYTTMTPWPANIAYALFADRATAYANPEYAHVFAYRYDNHQKTQQYQLIQTVFSAQPTDEALRHLHDVLKVKVLLVDKFDAVWHSEAIERSGLYRLVEKETDFKIYVAQ